MTPFGILWSYNITPLLMKFAYWPTKLNSKRKPSSIENPQNHLKVDKLLTVVNTPPTAPTAKPNPIKSTLNPYEERSCYKCQGFGHIALDCPSGMVITLVEYQELEEARLKEEGSDKQVHLIEIEDKYVVRADKGELLMIKRALNGNKSSNHEEQCKDIFHTRCTINCQVCSLIVDGGSCTNVASTTLVLSLIHI